MNFTPQITIPQWLQLPHEVRQRLRVVFSIPRSEGTSVLGNTIISDGCNHRDLSVVTVEGMKEYLGSALDDFFQLWNETTKKVYTDWQQELHDQVRKEATIRATLDQEKIDSLRQLTKEVEEIANSASAIVEKAKRGRPRKEV